MIENTFTENERIEENKQIRRERERARERNNEIRQNINKEWIDVAFSFLGAPYLWGGKTFIGIDCSGLVQLALSASGILVPRNTDEQAKNFHNRLKTVSKIERGCLIFWKGHVAIVLKKNKLLHSNAYHMCVQTEPLNKALSRIKEKYGDITTIKKVLI